MEAYQNIAKHFQKRGPLLNIILDGYGLGPSNHTNALHVAKTPNLQRLWKNYVHTQLLTHGAYVGLPNLSDMGGSEVGHMTIGAGKIIQQGPSVIKEMLDNDSFFRQKIFTEGFAQAQNYSLHLIGLLSDGNIHSHLDHTITIIEEAAQRGVRHCYLHALLDGRDVGIQSALQYTELVERVFSQINLKEGYDYRFASAGGRETITMDRTKNWEKIRQGWETHVAGNSGNNFSSIEAGILYFRRQSPDLIDQDIPPFNIVNEEGQPIKVNTGDVVIFTNFRGDRAIELTRAFLEKDFNEFEKTHDPSVYFAGMAIYDEDTNMPSKRIIERPMVDKPFGKRILEYGCRQFRLAESQKFPHVTFFFNGGYRLPLDEKLENYCEIPSDRISSFDMKPQMKAQEIAKQAVIFLKEKVYDFGLINFANCDMVGHTGNFKAVVAAAEATDRALGTILKTLDEQNGIAVITADHGNADQMVSVNKITGKLERDTKHTLNPVPFIIFDSQYKLGKYALKTSTPQEKMSLSMIASTNHILMGREVPDDLDTPLF